MILIKKNVEHCQKFGAINNQKILIKNEPSHYEVIFDSLK